MTTAKLLLVEDNRFYRVRLAELFTSAGHDVEFAADADHAIDTARRFRPDVLVIDQVLGGELDGLDVVEALLGELPSMRVVMITGYPSALVERRAAELHTFALIEKPFDPQDLCDAVRRAAEYATE